MTARMAELVDAIDSKSIFRKKVSVQVRVRAPSFNITNFNWFLFYKKV